jgi:predicted transcriptional regulator of viral defense system
LNFHEYIHRLVASGRYTFSWDDVVAYAGGNVIAAKSALARLSRKGRIASIYRGFYAVIPAEYSARGIVPAEWFLDALFRHIGSPYYLGVLSAAALHGAAHQQPQEYQIVVPRPMRSISVRGLRIHFFVRTHHDSAVVMRRNTQTGTLVVSDAATTALDLVRYQASIGGIPRVFTILQELGEAIDSMSFRVAAQRESVVSIVQRTAMLLDAAGYSPLAEHIPALLAERRARLIPLDPSAPRSRSRRGLRWRVDANIAPVSE